MRVLLADDDRAVELRRAAGRWPSYVLDPAGLTDVELLLTGALGPLDRYLGPQEAAVVARDRRLPEGGPFPVPVTLPVPDAVAAQLSAAEAGVVRLALHDPEGVLLAAVTVTDVAVDAGGRRLVAGPVEGVALPEHHDFPALRRSPAPPAPPASGRLLAVSDPAGHRSIAAGRELAGRIGAALLLLAGCAPHGPDDTDFAARARAFRDEAQPGEAVRLLETRWCGADIDGTLARAWVARSYGATDIAVPAEHAGAAEALLPDVAVHCLEPTPAPALPRAGLTVFFTGLSGSGKSTIAHALIARLAERGGRTVSLLDGDVVRRHLSAGLGFSRADRDTNIRRIGWVAAQIAKHGGVAVCCPIAPYDATRRDVRAMVESVGDFVLVHVATPLPVCEARDRKGLYARARAGEIAEFTGISDPYEPPADAEVVVDTSVIGVDDAADAVLGHLDGAGLLA